MAGKARKKKKLGEARVRLKCPVCGHVWNYTGKKGLGEVTTCPLRSCCGTVPLNEKTIIEIYDEDLRRSFEEYLKQKEEAEQEERASGGVNYQGIKERLKIVGSDIPAPRYKSETRKRNMRDSDRLIEAHQRAEAESAEGVAEMFLSELGEEQGGAPEEPFEDFEEDLGDIRVPEAEALGRAKELSEQLVRKSTKGQAPLKFTRASPVDEVDRLLLILTKAGVVYADVISNLVYDGIVDASDPFKLWKTLRSFNVSNRDCIAILSYFYKVDPSEIEERVKEWDRMDKERRKKVFEKAGPRSGEEEPPREGKSGPPTERSIAAEAYRILTETDVDSDEFVSKLEKLSRKLEAQQLAEVLRKKMLSRLLGKEDEEARPREEGNGKDTVTLFFRGQEVRVPFEKLMAIMQNPEARKFFGLEEPGGSDGGEKIPWTDPDTGVTVKVSPETYAMLRALSGRKQEDKSDLVDWVNPKDGSILKVPRDMVMPLTMMAIQSRSSGTSEQERLLQEKINQLERRNLELMENMRAQQIAREVGDNIAGSLGGVLKQAQDEIKELKRELEALKANRERGSDFDTVVSALSKFQQVTGVPVTFGGVSPQLKGMDIEEKRVMGEQSLAEKELEFKQNVVGTVVQKAAELADYAMRRSVQESTPPPDVGPEGPWSAPPPPPPNTSENAVEEGGEGAVRVRKFSGGGEEYVM